MNRITGLILALVVALTAGACATAGSSGSSDAMGASGNRPSDNSMTREANREIGLAMLQEDPEEQRGHFERALESAKEAVEEDPDNPRGWFLTGQASAYLGDYVGADTAFTKAQELHPPYEEEIEPEREQAWVNAYNAGVEALNTNDIEEAIAQMEHADRMYRKRPEALLNLGSFYSNLNELEKAADAYRRAIEVIRSPANEDLDEELVAEWAENEEIAVFNLAQLLTNLEEHAEAEALYREHLERNPEDISALVNLAEALSNQERTDEAEEIYNELLGRDDLEENDYIVIGVGMFGAENYDGAADAFRHTVRLNPHSRDAFYNLAQSLYVMANDLVADREEASDAEATAINERLMPIYEELGTASETVLEMDPLNRNIIAFMVGAYQGLAEMTEGAERDEYLRKIQTALDAHESFRYELVDVNISTDGEVVFFNGLLRNIDVDPGDRIGMQIEILSSNGAVIGTQEVAVSAPEADGTASFDAEISVSGSMAGWRYDVLD